MDQYGTVYNSYLIRIWSESQVDSGGDQWHIELESIQTGQKRQFPDLDALRSFLLDQMGERQDK
jgi:hypothetical protein